MNNDPIDKTQAFDDAAPAARQRRLQLVRAGSSQFGIFADEIAAIVVWRQLTPLPHAPKAVLGVVSVQGRMLTVLDLASLSGVEATQFDEPNDASGAAASNALSSLVALRGDEQLALAVAQVDESIVVDNGEFGAQVENAGRLILGVLQRDGARIKILNLRELFPAAIQGRQRRRRRF
jgi:purine-binding chemotaxis protein CheW